MITASVAIGDSKQSDIEGYAIELHTPDGLIQVGVDNEGNTYLSSSRGPLLLRPQSSNRVLVRVE